MRVLAAVGVGAFFLAGLVVAAAPPA